MTTDLAPMLLGQAAAPCAVHPDPDMWTRPVGIHDPDAVAAARICRTCPVIEACHQWAQEHRPRAVAAGLLWSTPGAPGKPRPAPQPRAHRARCGTSSGYERHRRLGEQVCQECREAYRDYQRVYKNARRTRRGAAA